MGGPRLDGLSDSQRTEMWCRWKAGYRMREIARALRVDHGSIRSLLCQRGGFAPAVRSRSFRTLALAEREDISRGIAAGDSVPTMGDRPASEALGPARAARHQLH